MITPDRKVRELMEEYEKTGVLRTAALRSDMDEKTARRYVKAGKLPSQMRIEHTWRTREDPFAQHWPEVAQILQDAPELEAKALFERLCELHPGVYQEGQLRTFQRKVRRWRAQEGPAQEVFFAQEHRPGVRMSTDWTHMGELAVTIGGDAFDHLLCHCVLTYSNWEWASVCHSESMLSLRNGLQAALFQLGSVPREHWTDHSSAATHVPSKAQEDTPRVFNEEYAGLMEHFGLTARTIQVDCPHENGDVESLNGALKRRIKQHLLLRGSRDFESHETYRLFLEDVLRKANACRTERLAHEMRVMRELSVSRLAAYRECVCRVTRGSTISVERRTYSVPSRLIGQKVTVRRYETRVEVLYQGAVELEAPWISRDTAHWIDYRHVVHSLVRKPGAFDNYRFRSDMFPACALRWAYDMLHQCGDLEPRAADREYLQILEHAANTLESDVVEAVERLRDQRCIPRLSRVLAACPVAADAPPEMAPKRVSLAQYDQLLSSRKEVAA